MHHEASDGFDGKYRYMSKVEENEVEIRDSEASVHMTPSAATTYDFKPSLAKGVKIASGEILHLQGHGSVNMVFRSNGKFTKFALSSTAYVPRLRFDQFYLIAIH